jgi:hypothetical protein
MSPMSVGIIPKQPGSIFSALRSPIRLRLSARERLRVLCFTRVAGLLDRQRTAHRIEMTCSSSRATLARRRRCRSAPLKVAAMKVWA